MFKENTKMGQLFSRLLSECYALGGELVDNDSINVNHVTFQNLCTYSKDVLTVENPAEASIVDMGDIESAKTIWEEHFKVSLGIGHYLCNNWVSKFASFFNV